MTEQKFFKLAIFIPLIVPTIAGGMSFLGIRDETPISGFLVASLLVGGAPYAICAALAIFWLYGKNARQHLRLAQLAPVLFIPFLAAAILVTESLGRNDWSVQSVVVE